MYGIILSVCNTALSWLFREVVIKFLVFTAIYFLISNLANNLAEFLGGQSLGLSPSALTNLLSQLPAGTWYWLDLFSFTQGACLIFSAMVYRFLIRRIPFIG